jgi:hypothetical protein
MLVKFKSRELRFMELVKGKAIPVQALDAIGL